MPRFSKRGGAGDYLETRIHINETDAMHKARFVTAVCTRAHVYVCVYVNLHVNDKRC